MRTEMKRGVCAVALCLGLVGGFGACHKDDDTNANKAAAPPVTRPTPMNTNTAPVNANTSTAGANDTAIKSSVEANLAKANVKGVTVTVKDGVVMLDGKVSAADFTKAMQAANEATPKAVKVDNSKLTKS